MRQPITTTMQRKTLHPSLLQPGNPPAASPTSWKHNPAQRIAIYSPHQKSTGCKAAKYPAPSLQQTTQDTTSSAGPTFFASPQCIFQKNLFQTLKIYQNVSPKNSTQTTYLKMIHVKYQFHLDLPCKKKLQPHKRNQTQYLTVHTLPLESPLLECPFSARLTSG